MADAYLKHHKQCNITTDPLAEILSNITKNPAAYAARQTTNDSEQSNRKQKEEAKDNEHCGMEASNITKQPCTQVANDNRTIIKYRDTIRTRSGLITKKWTDWNTDNHQDRPGRHVSCSKNVVQPTALFCNSKHLLYDILCQLLAG